MAESTSDESLSVVYFLVQSDDRREFVELEVGKVILWRVKRVAVLNLALLVGSAEGDKLLGYEPVEITILKQ